RPKQRGLAIVSNSGGISSSTADICSHNGLEIPPLSEKSLQGINDILKGRGWAANPADVTGFANSESFPRIMDYLIEEPGVGTLVIASTSGGKRVMRQAEQAIALSERSAKRIVYIWGSSRENEPGLDSLKRAGVPVFYTPGSLARAFRKLV